MSFNGIYSNHKVLYKYMYVYNMFTRVSEYIYGRINLKFTHLTNNIMKDVRIMFSYLILSNCLKITVDV